MVALTLEDVGQAELTAAEALVPFKTALATLTSQTANDIYVALRSWLWKAINGRRRDDDLREWYSLMQRVAARVEQDHASIASKIEVLQDLLYETIGVSEMLPQEDVLRRKHVRDLLVHLSQSGNRLPREAIATLLSLRQANLTRVLNLALSTGLVERRAHGKQAWFELTREGLEAVRRLGPVVVDRPPFVPGGFVTASNMLAPHHGYSWLDSPPIETTPLAVVAHDGAVYARCEGDLIEDMNLLYGRDITALSRRSMTAAAKVPQQVAFIATLFSGIARDRKKAARAVAHPHGR